MKSEINRSKLGKFTHTHINQTNIPNNQWKKEKKVTLKKQQQQKRSRKPKVAAMKKINKNLSYTDQLWGWGEEKN